MRKGHHEGEVDHHHFAHHLAAILKGGPSEQAVLLASLVSPDHEDVLPEHLVKVGISLSLSVWFLCVCVCVCVSLCVTVCVCVLEGPISESF